ncbi:ABC transporter substrate-binding protein [Agilicoccus flavus]|uniref:ABC transporter substrate-binding protein n=1 Tax=Agilicoccus flavus TaxID=2775968 RepID=UPI001CF71665|nr:extracellular solute-binding protein [Agilicoccus flavus]
MSRRTRTLLVGSTAVLATLLASCGGGDEGSASPSGGDGTAGGGGKLLVWSLENQPDRIAQQKKIVADFQAKTGTQVELVGIDEAQFPQLVASAAQSGNLPDAIGSLSLGYVRQIDGQQLVDREANTAVVDALGKDTFAKGALDLVADQGAQLAVPSDSWSQILVYRKDLFAKAGLKPPQTYEDLQAAATKLTSGKQFGVTLATDPADPFTTQTFESLAVGNDCQLVDGSGNPALSSGNCSTTFGLYADLAQKSSPKGKQDVDTTRAAYFSGQAAMVMWSTFILDEMAGLRNDALPTCPECKADPTFLSKNSGIVTNIKGPNGSGQGGFGEVSSWVVTAGGEETAQAKAWVQYMLSDGYTKWLGQAPEGKYPVRLGTSAGSNEYAEAWAKLPAGVDKKAPLSTLYAPETLKVMQDSVKNLQVWGIPQGQGRLLGSVMAELPISKAVASLGSGTSAADAQKQANDAVTEIKSGLQ